MRVAIIGAGPSGLVTLKYLLSAHKFFPIEPIEARIFEAEDGIGGTFRYRTYEDAELVSSKQLTIFSDLRIPLEKTEYKDFLSATQYLGYLEDYCDHFELRPHISLSTRVKNIKRRKAGGHIVTYTGPDGSTVEWTCDAVAVCSGLHVKPVMPDIPGLERVPVVMHSSQFKERKQFGVGTNVAVLGCGETAMDVSHLAVTSPVNSVILCHRDGFCLAPKAIPDFIIFGKPERGPPVPPIDVSASSLFDSAYVHPKLKNAPWIWEYYDKWTKFTWLLVDGTRWGYGQHVGQVREDRFHMSKVIFIKSNNASPYINYQYAQRDTLLQRLRRCIIDIPRKDIGDKKIDLAPFPERVDEQGIMHFKRTDRKESARMEGVVFKPDVVVCATGYTHDFPFLDKDYPSSGDADVRSIWKTGDETVGFIGFVRPALGAIPPLAEFQAQLWILNLLHRIPAPLQPENSYKLHHNPDQRLQHGVDHETYAYQLACDMGSAPSFSDILPRGLKVSLTWALGANFNTKFRLVGPWKWDGAEDVVRTELWQTIARRRIFWGQLTNAMTPLVLFGVLSFLYWVFYSIADTLDAVKSRITGKRQRQSEFAPILLQKS